jgi:DNA-directed RNA polymerase specialized sigma24 family protein
MDELSSQPAAQEHVPGIYEFVEQFGETFLEIAKGVEDAMPSNVDFDDWQDILQETSLAAVKSWRSDPEYFEQGAARRWASHVAHNKRTDQARSEERRVNRHELFMREFLAGSWGGSALEQIIEDERDRTVAREFALLAPQDRWIAFKHWIMGVRRADTAAELGMGEPDVRRSLEKTRRHLGVVLKEWKPGSSRAHGRGAPKPKDVESRASAAHAHTPPQASSQQERGEHE